MNNKIVADDYVYAQYASSSNDLKGEGKDVLKKKQTVNQGAFRHLIYDPSLQEEESAIPPLGNQRVKKLQRLVCHFIDIDCKDGSFFSIVNKDLLNNLHIASEKKGEFFLIGGKCSDLIDSTTHSKDIDFQHLLPVDTTKNALNRLLNNAKNYFVDRSGKSEHYLLDQKIIKIVVNTRDNNLFYTLKFSDRWGMSYDLSIVAKLARRCLFEHDARKIPITKLVESVQGHVNFDVLPINPLKTGMMPAVYRKKKLLHAPDPQTINFPGCLRLFSYYVKGWHCLKEDLERDITDSFVLQWKTNSKNDLRQSFRNIIKDHHDGSYAAAVTFAFNLLGAIERHSHSDVYEKAKEDCLEVLKGMAKQTLPHLLENIENALFAGTPLDELLINAPKINLEGQKTLVQYKADDYYLIAFAAHALITITEVSPASSIPQKKKQVNCTSEHFLARLQEDYTLWEYEEICRFLDELSIFCKRQKKPPINLIGAIEEKLCELFVYLARKDALGSSFFQYFPYFASLHAFKLTEDSFLTIRGRCLHWMNHPAISVDVLEKIHAYFFYSAEGAQQIIIAQALVEKGAYQSAKRIIDTVPEKFVTGDLCFELVEGLIKENPDLHLKLYSDYQNFLLAASNIDVVRIRVVELIDRTLRKNAIGAVELNALMEVACNYRIRNGEKWKALLLKALGFSQKTMKKAICLFLEHIVPQDLATDDLSAYMKCWKKILHKMGQKHDERLETLIVNPAPILKIKELYPNADLNPLFDQLVDEAIYRMRKGPPNYQKYFWLMDTYGSSPASIKEFIAIYVASPNIADLLTVCEKIRKNIHIFVNEELLVICKEIEKRKCEFCTDVVHEQLMSIVRSWTSSSSPRDTFLARTVLVCTIPSIQELVVAAAKDYLSSINKAMFAEGLKNVLEDILTFVASRDASCSVDELIISKKLLSFQEFDSIEDEKYSKQLWMNRIVLNFRIFIQSEYDEKLLTEAFEYFCAHFHRLYNDDSNEHICLAFAARALGEIFVNSLDIFIYWKDCLAAYLSDHEEIWMSLGKNDKRQIPMPPIEVTSLTSYQFCSQTNMGENSKTQPYVPFSEQYVNDLKNSRDLKSAYWSRFSRFMCFTCECLLRTRLIDREREEFLLNFTGEFLEILMLGDAHLTYDDRGIQNENIAIVLEIFLKRKGYPSLLLALKQMSMASRLFTCAFFHNYVFSTSSELFFYNLFLDFRLSQPLLTKVTYKYEIEIKKMIDWAVEKGSIYSLIRVLSIMVHLSKLKSIINLPGYNKRYILPLKIACQNLTKDNMDSDELPLLEKIHELINKLNTV